MNTCLACFTFKPAATFVEPTSERSAAKSIPLSVHRVRKRRLRNFHSRLIKASIAAFLCETPTIYDNAGRRRESTTLTFMRVHYHIVYTFSAFAYIKHSTEVLVWSQDALGTSFENMPRVKPNELFLEG